MKKYQIIEITWLDSMHQSGWQKEKFITLSGKELEHKTIGYFLRQDKRSIIVCQSFQKNCEEKAVDAIMEIPQKIIINKRLFNRKI